MCICIKRFELGQDKLSNIPFAFLAIGNVW